MYYNYQILIKKIGLQTITGSYHAHRYVSLSITRVSNTNPHPDPGHRKPLCVPKLPQLPLALPPKFPKRQPSHQKIIHQNATQESPEQVRWLHLQYRNLDPVDMANEKSALILVIFKDKTIVNLLLDR